MSAQGLAHSRQAPHADWLQPEWGATGVGALMSTRHGGVSTGPYDSLNLGAAVSDDPDAVAANRARFAASLGGAPVFMKQVHGVAVAHLQPADALRPAGEIVADACVTATPGVACVVQVADCLPVLLAAPGGRAVGAAHAGWRGLAGGVLENTVAAVCDLAGCAPSELHAWLGACIGPTQFEVGGDVLAAFGADQHAPDRQRFVPGAAAGKWLAHLPQLARDRLQACGVVQISGGAWCTVSDPSRFFSYRRHPVTGRLAAAVWIDG
jgi:YfiH family protein